MIDILKAIIPGELIVGAIVAAITFAATWFGAKMSGKKSAQIDTLNNEVKAHEIRDEVENRIATERDARERLRDNWSE